MTVDLSQNAQTPMPEPTSGADTLPEVPFYTAEETGSAESKGGDDDSTGAEETTEETDAEEDDTGAEPIDNLPIDDAVTEEDDSGDEEVEDEDLDEDDASTPQGISQELLFEAAQAGLSFEEASAFGGDTGLKAALAVLKDRLPAKDESGSEQSEAAPTTEEIDTSVVDKWFEIPEEVREDMDEDMLGVMDGMNKHARDAVKAIHSQSQQQVQQLTDTLSNLYGALEGERFDSSLTRVGEAYQAKVGAGDIDSVSDTEFGERNKVHSLANQLQAKAQEGGARLSRDEAVRQALAVTYPDIAKTIKRNEIIGKTNKRKGNKARRPGSKATDHLTEEERALKDIEQMQRDMGASPSNEPAIPMPG